MKKIVEIGVVVLILLGVSGCLQVSTVVKVKPDGSGTIEETFLMNKEFVQQMDSMMGQMTQTMEQGEKKQKSKKKQAEKGFNIFNEAELKKKAGEKGEGVKYVSGKKIMADKFEGYKVIYAFKDINKLRFNQNPGESVPSGSGGKDKESEGKKEFVTFHFTKGQPSQLIVRLPADKITDKPKSSIEDSKKEQVDKQQEEMMMNQMKMMFEGMKISLAVEVQGSIVETNATYREGSKITLMEMDFGKLIEAPEEFKRFNQVNPQTLEDAKKLMKDIPGIKVELNKEVMIDFK